MVYIYALELEDGKYYIGKTDNPEYRIENHFNSTGSAWTKLYKPLKAIEIKPDCDDYDEDKITIQYMDKYGIDNVRGGSFVSVKLDDSTVQHLKQMSNGTNDRCFVCGAVGHFAKDCTNLKDSQTQKPKPNRCKCVNSIFSSHYEVNCVIKSPANFMKGVVFVGNKINKIIQGFDDENDNPKPSCVRCGRDSHSAQMCYATSHLKGYKLTAAEMKRVPK